MNFYARGFNLYLLAALLLCGCATKDKDKNAFLGTLRVHIESSGTIPDGGQKIKLLRANPVEVTVDSESILSEANILAVTLVNTPGGFAIKIRFDETGSWTLEQFSAANPGRHFVIFGQWDKNPGDGRWLAAPLITRRISDGTLVFTPDCSHEEARKLMISVNLAAKKIHTGSLK